MQFFPFLPGPSDGGLTKCLETVYIHKIKELKDSLNITRRQLDDVRSEVARQKSTIAEVTSHVYRKSPLSTSFFAKLNKLSLSNDPPPPNVFERNMPPGGS